MIPGFGAPSGGAGPEGRTPPMVGELVLPVLLGAFGFFGLFWGAFAVLLADLSSALDLSPGPLGFALFVGAAASILAMALLGWAADRLGRRPFLVASASVFGGWASSGWRLPRSYATLLVALVTLFTPPPDFTTWG